MVIQNKVKPAGIKTAPNKNSLMVRPLEILAKKIPTKGDQETHQPQYKMVQPPTQSVSVGKVSH